MTEREWFENYKKKMTKAERGEAQWMRDKLEKARMKQNATMAKEKRELARMALKDGKKA